MTSVDPGLNPLLTGATPELYVHNAFRLTGLPVTASTREVTRYGDKLKLLHEVGGQAAAALPTLLDGTQAPGAEDLREALRQLKDLRSRMLHEFFWMWPEDWHNPDADEAFAALKRLDLEAATKLWATREAEGGSCVSTHNLAVLGHMRALNLARQDAEEPLNAVQGDEMRAEWRSALTRWHRIADDDRLWDFFKARIAQIDDPAVTTGMARRLRADLPQALARVNARLALAHAENGRRVEAQWQVSFLKSCRPSDPQTTIDALDHLLTKVRERLARSIENAKQATDNDKLVGNQEARQMLDATAPLLEILEQVQGEPERRRDFQKVANAAIDTSVLNYNAIYYPKQPSFEAEALAKTRPPAEEHMRIMVRARALSTDPKIDQIIESNIKKVQAALQKLPSAPIIVPEPPPLPADCESDNGPEDPAPDAPINALSGAPPDESVATGEAMGGEKATPADIVTPMADAVPAAARANVSTPSGDTLDRCWALLQRYLRTLMHVRITREATAALSAVLAFVCLTLLPHTYPAPVPPVKQQLQQKPALAKYEQEEQRQQEKRRRRAGEDLVETLRSMNPTSSDLPAPATDVKPIPHQPFAPP